MSLGLTVLIVTHSRDNESVEYVSRALSERGARTVRLDTDRFPTEVRLALWQSQDGSERALLTSAHEELELAAVDAIWYRRFAPGACLPETMDPQLRAASVKETHVTLAGLIASLPAFQLDPAWALRRAEHKPLQLQLARECGLDLPRTRTSNDPDAVRAFAASCDGRIVTKMLSSFAIDPDSDEKVVFTNPVSAADLADLDGLDLCPMTFQEEIPKALELRATIVGRRVFTAAIDSQRSEAARHDWRRDGLGLLTDWQPYELPAAVEAGLLRMMDAFGLNYGAADLIRTPEGRHVFLEVNPAGEFFWLERAPGLPIAAALADVLTGRAPRRRPEA